MQIDSDVSLSIGKQGTILRNPSLRSPTVTSILKHILHITLLRYIRYCLQRIQLVGSAVNVLDLLMKLAFFGADDSIQEFT